MTSPAKIAISRSRSTLQIIWDDGHRSEYPLGGLRSACPCAQCRGSHEAMSVRPSPRMLEVPLAAGQSADLERIDTVGNYALQPVWKDGHCYGIYSWEYLRDLCPCPVRYPRDEHND